ncbi:Transcription initiation factor TFIID subunit 5 [Neolecta irregularis DAH-3]|uniref:Transcription initiation factor TFIID subunit 5 n=1 Tax=Neolecta irregularis (strain DAH-3) TaxID=1198029 RepID=A0A1U7LGE8_NEOID|nr:Transcription initiation factor TFIID subunit 5 [Neolecta irregularis DAH-3]|eukprot:OLL21698.1 Transcription initiation factor TFIID subunit 5 [Neolecta irregularis DAH-3]
MATSNAASQQFSPQDLNRIVLEYLNKKGYTKTEAMLRLEAARAASGADPPRPRDDYFTATADSYAQAYVLVRSWVESSLDLYRPELRRILYPLFVHSFLDLVAAAESASAKDFFDTYGKEHELHHPHDMRILSTVTSQSHIKENELAILYRANKYNLRFSRTTFDLMMHFLDEHHQAGGKIALRLINSYINMEVLAGARGAATSEDILAEGEGISGQHDKSLNEYNSQDVKLGILPPEESAEKEMEAILADEDAKSSATCAQFGSTDSSSLVEEYKKLRHASSSDGPSREAVPLPPMKGIDFQVELRTVKDYRRRLKLDPQSALPSVCMYTLHNTHDGLNCIDFSKDASMLAGGFAESYVKIWSLKGDKLKGPGRPEKDGAGMSSRRMISHSGPVYGVDFSPDNRYLLSCSEDTTVRLWSLDTFTAMVAYKGHAHPIWDVAFGPFGHYFATASHDQTARLWSCEHITPLRIFAGHLSDVDCVQFHPNSAYVATGSSDKTCRLWDVQRGQSVRVFAGHNGPVTCITISPDGKWLASAGEDGVISIWDLGSGKRLKAMRGHAPGSIYSLSFSQEGTVLVSGGSDMTVRVWDVKKSPCIDTATLASITVAAARTQLAGKEKPENTQTDDHLKAFHTKRTPVYQVHFTRTNLVLAAGAFSL